MRDAHAVACTPWDYQRYIQESRGEFSCVKPSCVRLQNAWISDRTLCYLASGKPAVVQNTGPSAFLPESEGIFRFHTMEEAVEALAREHSIKIQAGAARRNIITSGMPLNHLVGQDFAVGSVVLRGMRLCEPCAHLASLTKRGIVKGLVHRGGLRAEIVSGGEIRIGDVIRSVQSNAV